MSRPLRAIELLLDSARGRYIPRDFASDFNWQGVSEDEREVLADPYHENYWEVWDTVSSNAHYIDEASGWVYHLHQDSDLWAICFDELTETQRIDLGFDL